MVQLASPASSAPAPRMGGLAAFCAERFGPRPAVTVYRADGGRVEISGSVLANWADKTSNFAEEELLQGEPGGEASVGLRPGWRQAAVLAGLWQAGISTVPLEDAAQPAPAAPFAFLDSAASAQDLTPRLTPASVTVLVPRGDLARSWDGDALPPMPGEVLDYAQIVPGFGDRFFPSGSPVAEALSLSAAGLDAPDLGAPGSAAALRLDSRGLLELPGSVNCAEAQMLAVPCLLASGRSVVLIEYGADAQKAAEENRARLL